MTNSNSESQESRPLHFVQAWALTYAFFSIIHVIFVICVVLLLKTTIRFFQISPDSDINTAALFILIMVFVYFIMKIFSDNLNELVKLIGSSNTSDKIMLSLFVFVFYPFFIFAVRFELSFLGSMKFISIDLLEYSKIIIVGAGAFSIFLIEHTFRQRLGAVKANNSKPTAH